MFLLSAIDGNPHQVRIEEVRLRTPGSRAEGHALRTFPMVLEVQPGPELVVPFDVRSTEVPRGTYAVGARVLVDGIAAPEALEQAELRVR
ncbi:MAG TPA: hypothetical protein VEO00_03555 [Actinomycetota bacterium]|nr:hypothetical protein [Actinomycetota bacterium]